MKDFINIGGNTYRVEVNWNAISEYLVFVGRDDIQALANFGQLKPSDLTALLAASINEGERLEGNDVHFTPQELGEKCDFAVIGEFLQIYIRQSSPKGQDEETDGKKA